MLLRLRFRLVVRLRMQYGSSSGRPENSQTAEDSSRSQRGSRHVDRKITGSILALFAIGLAGFEDHPSIVTPDKGPPEALSGWRRRCVLADHLDLVASGGKVASDHVRQSTQ